MILDAKSAIAAKLVMAPPEPPVLPTPSERHASLILLTVTAAMVGDCVEAVILPAIPVTQREFDISPTLASWVTSILLVVGAASLPLFGKLGDTGKKRMFLIAMGLYSIGVIPGLLPASKDYSG